MVPQIAVDPLHGNEPDLPNTPAYVNPPGGYGVVFDASHSVGIQPTTTFEWTVTDSAGQSTYTIGEEATISLAQSPYTVPPVVGSCLPRCSISSVSPSDSHVGGEG